MQVYAERNSDGIFVNTETLREEANHFLKHGYYCPDPWGSPAWKEYWNEQLRRCQDGYSSGGLYITGNHYGYLNFAQIKLTKEFVEAEESMIAEASNLSIVEQRRMARIGGNGAAKDVTFPSFWSSDYNYYHVVDIARWGAELDYIEGLGLEVQILPDYLKGGFHVIVGKSRRKGYSYKNGWMAANNYNTIENSVTIIGAFDKKYLYPEGTMKMANDYVNFFNEHTGWAKARDFVNKVSHKKASYEEKDENNISVEKGYKSTIMALSFGDNPDAAIGKDGTLVEFEEAGKFPNLKESYMKTKPAMEDGIYTTGQMLVFGTGGDMDNATTDFAEMFYNPIPYKLLPFKNIWDNKTHETSKCGFFVPDYWNKPGFIDQDGNSDNAAAKAHEENERQKIIMETSGSSALNEYTQQYPFSPEEAFLQVSGNEFPVEELRARLATVIEQELYSKKTQPVTLYKEDGKVKIKPDLKGKLTPINYFPMKEKDKTGAVVILEPPVNDPQVGFYKAGYDPYRQDQSEGVSLGSIYIYKSSNNFSYTRDILVAWYVGRPQTSDIFNRNVEMLCELYNLEMMHENEVTEVVSYFRRRRKLHLLASQPDAVISKNIKNSTVSRIYGIHMVDKLKDAGEKYIKIWLLAERDYDETGKKVLNLETIVDIGLLQELIAYSRKGNFDRVMSFMMVMFQLEEEEEGKEYGKNTQSQIAREILELDLYSRS